MRKLQPEKGYLTIKGLGSWVTHLMGPYLTLWLKNIGLSYTQIGLAQSVSSFTSFITDFPTGGLADRYGRRLNYAFGLFLFSIGLLIIALFKSFTLVLLGMTLGGLGQAFMSGTLVPWLYDSLDDKRKAYNVFSKMKTINGILGAVAGATASLLSRYYLNLPLILSGAFGLLTAVLAVLLLEENYGHHGDKGYWAILKGGAKHILENRTLHLLLASSLLLTFSARTFFMFWMLLAKNIGLKGEYLGYVYTLLILSTSLGGAISVKLSKMIDYKKVAVAGTVAFGIVLALMGFTHSIYQLLVLLVAIEVVMSVRGPAMLTLRNEIIPSEGRSTITSALSTITSLFAMIANIAVGAIADAMSLKTLYIIAGCLALAASLFIAMATKRA
ncbi:hypothetical protein PAP_09595 [Palaeococcus pacificus DY20341]|uniref:Major facilitator superfamily (MFS) profile domain-containing protein n=1 Tax=Palaeococcus pacificus DY20341 TaxID=1343739 RepID=A0A075LVC7_9EURY|nr:MFS transporter [Palaeococcus pacificus]AIF70294.1 hypothetical protein PAP_09595 [Palaeococcus pacificus DY20341]